MAAVIFLRDIKFRGKIESLGLFALTGKKPLHNPVVSRRKLTAFFRPVKIKLRGHTGNIADGLVGGAGGGFGR